MAPRTTSTKLLLLVLCGVLFLDGLDVSMVGVALPSIKTDLGLSTSTLQWVVSGYVLGYGGLLLLGGRTADLAGRRRTLLIALGLFTVASALAAFTSDGTLLIMARFLKGASAAFTAPAGLSIITTTFPEGPERNKALSIYSATGASGFSFGLVLGGLLTEIGWRWAFVLPAPVALVLLILGLRALPHDKPSALRRSSFDLPGAFALTTGMLLLVHTIVQAPSAGWTSAETLIAAAVSVALFVAFFVIEQRSKTPLVRLGILRNGSLVRANLGAAALFGGYVGFQFVLTLYLQATNGWSAIQTALAFLPAGIVVAFGSIRIGPWIDRLGTQRLVVIGSAAAAAAYALSLRLGATPEYGIVLLPTIVLLGVGFALNFTSLSIQATNGIADHEQGLASGLVQTSFQIGGAIVLAIVTAIVSAGTTGTDLIDAYRNALFVVTGIAVAGLIVSLSALSFGREPSSVEA